MPKVSAKLVVANTIRDLDLQSGSKKFDAMIEWCYEAEKLIGAQDSFQKKECELKITNYRAELPSDFIKLISIKVGDSYLEYTARDFTNFSKGGDPDEGGNLADRRSFDSQSNVNNPIQFGLAKFSIDGNVINVTIDSGTLGIAYFGKALDEQGYPLIEESHVEAAVAYLTYKIYNTEFIKGKISQGVFMEIKRRWLELCNNARGNSNLPDRKKADYIGGMWNSFKPSPPRELL